MIQMIALVILLIFLLLFIFVTHPHHTKTCCLSHEVSNVFPDITCKMLHPFDRKPCARHSITDTACIVIMAVAAAVMICNNFVYVRAHIADIAEAENKLLAYCICCSPVQMAFGTPGKLAGTAKSAIISAYHWMETLTILLFVIFGIVLNIHEAWACYKTSDPYEFSFGLCTNKHSAINTTKQRHRLQHPRKIGMVVWSILIAACICLLLLVALYVHMCRKYVRKRLNKY